MYNWFMLETSSEIIFPTLWLPLKQRSAFLGAFNHAELSDGEQHALRVCCLLALPPPPSGAGEVTLNVPPDLSQVSLPAIVRLIEDLASGMGRLGSYIEANCAVVSRTLILQMEKITGHPSCITCLRPRQMCDCRVTATYNQLRTSPPMFTTLTSTAPHQVSSQASDLHSMRMPSLGPPMATAWSSMGSTSLTTGWNPPGQPVFPTPMVGNNNCFTGQTTSVAPSQSMSGMPPLRQRHPTTHSQQPQQQATPYTPQVEVPRRVSFAPETSTSTGAPAYYLDMVKDPASAGRQSQGRSTERRQTSTTSGSVRSQDPYKRIHSKSQQRQGPGLSLTIGDTPVEVVPKDPIVPKLGLDQRHDSLAELVSLQ